MPRITNEMIWDRLAIIEGKLDELLSRKTEVEVQPQSPTVEASVTTDDDDKVFYVPCRQWTGDGRCGAKVKGTRKELGAWNNLCVKHRSNRA